MDGIHDEYRLPEYPRGPKRSSCVLKYVPLVKRIQNDTTYTLSNQYIMLPHGERLNMLHCKIERFHNTFVLSSIKVFNSK